MRMERRDTTTDRGSSEEDVYNEGGKVPFNVNNICMAIRAEQSTTTMNKGQGGGGGGWMMAYKDVQGSFKGTIHHI